MLGKVYWCHIQNIIRLFLRLLVSNFNPKLSFSKVLIGRDWAQTLKHFLQKKLT